ncbi:MAG: hypothetical protein AAB968_00470, partial [Patescibacteria group bacterium]
MSWYSEKIKINSAYAIVRRINALDILYPPFACLIIKLFAKARSEKLSVCIYETYRSQERQRELFNKGATKLKKNGMLAAEEPTRRGAAREVPDRGAQISLVFAVFAESQVVVARQVKD